MNTLTLTDIKNNNKIAGRHWFDKDTMRFFDSRIESKLYSDNTFITSEQQSYQHPREYTIRIALNNGIDIESVGEFGQFETLEQAREYRKTIEYKNDLINILNKYITNLIHKNKANRINAKRYLAIKDTLKGMEYAGISKDLNN